VGTSDNTIVDIFARIESFFERLEIYTDVQPTGAMKELIVRIMGQVLEVLGVTTKWIKQSPSSELVVVDIRRLTNRHPGKFVKKLVGRTDIEDAMKKLDKLTQEEALMASAEAMKLVRSVDNKMDTVIDSLQHVAYSSPSISLTLTLSRWDRNESSNASNGERTRWFDPFVILLLRCLWLARLKFCRRSVMREISKMALSSRSIDKF
jgi:hypothetical protein